MKKFMVMVMVFGLLLGGCSGFCAKYNTAADYMDTAQNGLHTANTIYGILESAKFIPALCPEATLALAAVDTAVPVLKSVLDGWCKDPDKLNAAIFSVRQAADLAEKLKAEVGK